MTNTLKQFYRDIWKWIQAGCPEHCTFSIHYGICHNLWHWSDRDLELVEEQGKYLLIQYGSAMLPFNNDIEEYTRDVKYQNPKRLAFIEEHAK